MGGGIKGKKNELLSNLTHTYVFVSYYFTSQTLNANSLRNKVFGFLAQQYREELRRAAENNHRISR